MRIEIDVRDDKADFVLELLRNLKFVRVKEREKEKVKEGIRDGLREAMLAEQGKIHLQPAREWLNGL